MPQKFFIISHKWQPPSGTSLTVVFFSNLQNTSHFPSSRKLYLYICTSLPVTRMCFFWTWCKNSLLFLISHFFLLLWTFMSASILWLPKTPLRLPFRPQNCMMPYLDTTFRQGFAGLCSAILEAFFKQCPAETPCEISFSETLTFIRVSQAHG